MKARHREAWALAITGAVLVLLFEAMPWVDLDIATAFHAGQGSFPAGQWLWVQALYRGTPWVGRTIFLATGVVLLIAWWRPALVSRRLWRRAAALHLVFLLGLGGVVHLALKEQWGRPRPYELSAFAGGQDFAPALRPASACRTNCSFVSGHAATGFAIVGLGMFAPRHWRRRWFFLALTLGLAIGAGRMLQGGHFLSDVLFAGWCMWAVAALVRQVWLRITLRRRQAASMQASALPSQRH